MIRRTGAPNGLNFVSVNDRIQKIRKAAPNNFALRLKVIDELQLRGPTINGGRMFYVKSEQDEFTDFVTKLEFGKSMPNLNFDICSSYPQIRLVPAEQFFHGKRILLIDKNTGSWCYLDSLEYEIYKTMEREDLRSILSSLTEEDRKEFQEFAGQLFWLNLLEINGCRFVNPEFFRVEPVYRPHPMFLIRVTNQCNLACKYCYSNSDPSRKEKMSWDIAKRVVDLIIDYPADWGRFLFHGGEPLLEPTLIRKIVSYARSRAAETGKEFDFGIQTNGTLLSRQLWNRINDLELNFGLSLDGDRLANNITRTFPGGRSSYDLVKRSLAMLGRKGKCASAILVMSKANYSRMPEILSHLSATPGLAGIKINPLHEDGRAKGEWNELTLTPEEFLNAHVAYLDYCQTADEPLIDANVSEMLWDIADNTRTYLCRKAKCGAGRDFFSFEPSGEIYPCDGWFDQRHLILGHVQNVENIESLLHQNSVMREISQRDCENISECKDCTYKCFCRGGCSLETYARYKRTDSPHPLCDYFRGMYSELFRRLPENPQLLAMIGPNKMVYDRHFFVGWGN